MLLRFSERARHGLTEIYRSRVKQFGLHQADNYRDSLLRVFDFISSTPLAVPEVHRFSRPVRLYNYQSHVIAFRVVGDIVVVGRVIDAPRDLDRLL